MKFGNDAESVTEVGFENQVGSQWGDQYFFPLSTSRGLLGCIVLQGGAAPNGLLDAKSYRIMGAYHGAGPGGWVDWSEPCQGPPTVSWLRKLFPNADITISDRDLLGAQV